MNYFNSPVTKAVTSSLRQSSVKLEKTWNPLQDHNYAARPVDGETITVNVNESSAQSFSNNGAVLVKLKAQEEVIEKQSSQLEKCKEEIAKKNSQLAETAGMMINYQKVRKKLISTELDVESWKSLVEEAKTAKTEVENKFKKFRSSATNLYCGVSVFVEEFRRQLLSWCVKTEVQEADKKLFNNGLDCISSFVDDKLQTWLRSGFLTQEDLEEAKSMIDSFAVTVTPEAGGWGEEEAKTDSVTSASSEETLPVTVVEEESVAITADLSTLPDLAEDSLEEKKEVVTDQKKHAIDETVAREQFLCICGAKCRNMSGLKLHVLMSNKTPKKATPLNSSKNRSSKSRSGGRRPRKTFSPVEIKSEPLTPPPSSYAGSTPPTEPEDLASDDDELITVKTENPDCKPTRKSTPSKTSVTPRPPVRQLLSKVALSFASKGASTSSPIQSTSIKEEETKEVPRKDPASSRKSGGKPLVPRSSHKMHPTNPLKCNCGYLATHSYILNRHIKYYKADRTFACKICPRLFVNNTYLNQHYRSAHKMKNPPINVDGNKLKETSSNSSAKTETSKPAYAAAAIRARLVSKKRRSAGKRKRKLLRITAKERISCQYCYRRFPHIRDLIRHISRRLHGGEGFASRYSHLKKKATGSKGNGKSVMSESDSTPRRSSRIHTASTTKSTMSLYYRKYGGPSRNIKPEVQKQDHCECSNNCEKRSRKRRAPPHCTICGYTFVCIVFLEKHIQEMHNDSKKLKTGIDCKKCGASFKTEKELARHSKYKRCRPAGSGSKNATLKKTKLSSSTSSSSKGQIIMNQVAVTQNHRQVQVKGSSSIFKCSCGKTYSSKRVLQKHVQEQRYGRIFKCSFCDHGFAKHYNLKKHVERVHHVPFYSQNMFGCGTCGKTFSSNSERFRHRSKHHKDQIPGKK